MAEIDIDIYKENAERDLQRAIEQGDHVTLNDVKTIFAEKLKAIHAQHGEKAAKVIIEHYKAWDDACLSAQLRQFEAVADADRVYYSWLSTFHNEKGA